MGLIHFKSTHFRYALTYVIITFFVLLFLNFYCSNTSRDLFYSSKEASMSGKCQLAADEISKLEVVNSATVARVISGMDSLKVNRLVVTDKSGFILYDSRQLVPGTGAYALYPEITQALQMSSVFTCNFHDGILQSNAAAPIVSFGQLLGAVYMMEYDIGQGALLKSLQSNILMITIILEIAVILFSLTFSASFTRRLRRIMTSMRIIRGGDYTQTVDMGGNDELTVLGDEFNDLVKRLQISENKRRQFVSDASHELKTPLASIKLLSDSILQNEMDMETAKEFVADIGNEADRLNRMSTKLLSLTKIESQVDSDCEIVDIAPTAEKVIRMLRELAQEHSITIHQNLSEGCPILVLEDDLYQIIFNLIENGIKYNVPNGILSVTVYRENDDAILQISDSGVGIPEESLSHIFERFYRVDKARSRESGGTGLGLSIARELAQLHGGDITVESRVGEGTAMTLSLPIEHT